MHGAQPGPARIGPNAILQLVPVLDARLGAATRHHLLAGADVPVPPPDAGMWPQDDVVRLHRAVIAHHREDSATLLHAAGTATADYILANRIPQPAQRLIRLMPTALGARVLAAAIARNAWTFAGSGRFSVQSHRPLTLSIAANPLACGPGDGPSCHWHSAVFERLFGQLVWRRARVRETTCCACGDAACRFEIGPEL